MPSLSARFRVPAARSYRSLRRALPMQGMFRLRPVADTWLRSGLSAVIAIGVPEVVLLILGRLDLALYTSAGGLCALYAHGLPYAARARTLAWVVFGMTAGTGVALATAVLTDSAIIKVAVIALLAGVFKMVCEATRIGPPNNIIFTFVSATAAFVPQRAGDVPGHLGLILLGGLLAWLVCMAPGLIRPHDPERFAVARVLEATAALLRAEPGAPSAHRLRHDAAAAVHIAWHTLGLVPARSHTRAAELTALSHLVVRAESLTATRRSDQADVLVGWARELRRGRPVPVLDCHPGEKAELRGRAAEHADSRSVGGFRRVARAFAPHSTVFPIGMRVALGSAAAGWASLALGVHRPYWAVVTATAVFVANTSLSWQRAVQRVAGNLGGVLLFTPLVPVTHGAVALVVVSLVCLLLAEGTISRNYALATVFVTPMALIMTEFAVRHPARELITDRWLDTCVGAIVGTLVCFAIPNRRVTGRVEAALRNLTAITRAAPDRPTARADLTAALIELREAADTAAGEWWSAPLPEERIVAAERAGHRVLADLSTRAGVTR